MKFAVRLHETFPDKPPPVEDIGRVFDTSGKHDHGLDRRGRRVVAGADDRLLDGLLGARARRATRGRRSRAAARPSARRGCCWPRRCWRPTAWDLYQDPKLMAEAKAEFTRRLDGRTYKPMLEKDQAPPLDYRLPAKRMRPSE